MMLWLCCLLITFAAYNRLTMACRFRLMFVVAAFVAAVVPSVSLRGQCFDMTSLDAPGVTCKVANHEWEYQYTDNVGSTIGVFTWVTYNNTYEDYGLTGYNNSYRVNNVLCTRQTVVEQQGPDYLQPALKMIPDGRSTSVRLGNPRAGGKGSPTYNPYTHQIDPDRYSVWHPQAEAMVYSYTVTADNPIVQFQYAALLDRVYHPMTGSNRNAQPRIEVFIANSSNTILDAPTTSFSHWGDASLASKPEWKRFARTGYNNMYWKDWSTVGFDLTPYIGQTVYFNVANYECVTPSPDLMGFKYCGEHFGYIYFYLDCAPKEIETECLDNRQVRLTAPDGFTYRWYSTGNPSVTLGTGRSVVVKADGQTTYACQMSQLEGMTGSFVLTTKPLCPVLVSIKDTVCSEDLPYHFAGKDLTLGGHYEDTVHLTADVDSITTLDLVVHQVVTMPMEEAYFCTGSSYRWTHGSHDIWLTKAGTYRDTIRYASGCDSARYTIKLDERDKIETIDYRDVCVSSLNGSYCGFSWNGIWINKVSDNGKTFNTTSVVSGCDSVVTLSMNLLDAVSIYDTIMLPPNFAAFTWHGYDVYWVGSKLATETQYKNYKSSTTVNCCKETTYLRLFVIEIKDSTETLTLCDSELPVTWRGHTITAATDNGKQFMQKGKSGLDSIRYTLALTVHPTYNLTRYDTICQNDSYPFGDTTITTTGIYRRHFTSQYGCDSTVTLHLTVQQPKTARTERVTLCDGETYNWEGHGTRFAGISQAGDYLDTAYYKTGCDSVYYMLRVVTGDSSVAHLNEHICHGESISFFGSEKKETGVYRGVIENMKGCDSIIYMHLSVQPKAVIVPRDTNVCAGTVFSWKGKTLTTDGSVYDTISSSLECDSIIYRYDVHFLTVTNSDEYATICEGGSVNFDGIDRTQEGIYTRTEVTPQGCTRTVTLHLTVNKPTYSDTTAVECGSFTWHGTNYTESADIPWHTTNQADCDSTRTLHLTINQPTSSDTFAIACSSFTWHGTTYTASADIPWDTTNQAGCDSTRTLHLTINHPTTSDTIAVADHSFTWHDITYTASGSYDWHTTNVAGCDSARTLHLTILRPTTGDTTAVACDSFEWKGKTYSSSGNYDWHTTNVEGFDSTLTLHLTIHPSYTITKSVSICEGMTYPLGDTILATTGVYTRTMPTVTGCDSTVTIDLTVGSVVSGDTTVVRCFGGSYRFIDTLITTSGDYEKLIVRTGQCDSLARLHFILLPDVVQHDSVAAFCQGEQLLWYGRTISTADSFTHIVPNMLGCDSLIFTLRTTVKQPSAFTLDTTICQGDSLVLTDTVLYAATTLTRTLTNAAGCDSLLTIRLHVQSPVTLPTDTVEIPDGGTYTWQGHPSFAAINTAGLYHDTLTYAGTGCDSVYASLFVKVYEAEVQGVFTVDTVCGDDDRLSLSFRRTQGRAVSYDLLFSEAAHSQGFVDITEAAFPDTSVVLWSCPMPSHTDDAQWYVRPERYSVTLRLTDAANRQSQYTASFTVLYPSWIILQRWNDVLTIMNSRYNGGYEFSAIQWLHNDLPVSGRGENNAYYYAGDGNRLDYGTPYRALLTRTDDGKTFSTCDYLPAVQYEATLVQQPMVSLLPRSEHSTRQVEIRTKTSGKYVVYDVAGKQVMDGKFGNAYGSPDLHFSATVTDGTYLIRFRSNDGGEQVFKWMVY